MTPSQELFFDALFPEWYNDDLYVYFAYRSGYDPEPRFRREFRTVKQVRERDGLQFLADQTHNWWVCPCPFNEQRGKQEYGHEMLSTVWIECDDPDVHPMRLPGIPPSMAVRSSPGRHHIYWLLDKPYDTMTVEAINRQMAYSHLRTDRSGWFRNKILRVPGTFNHKYDPPEPVYLVDMFRTGPPPRYSLDQMPLPKTSVNGVGQRTRENPYRASTKNFRVQFQVGQGF